MGEAKGAITTYAIWREFYSPLEVEAHSSPGGVGKGNISRDCGVGDTTSSGVQAVMRWLKVTERGRKPANSPLQVFPGPTTNFPGSSDDLIGLQRGLPELTPGDPTLLLMENVLNWGNLLQCWNWAPEGRTGK